MKKLLLLLLLFTGIANAQIVNIPDANFKAKLLAANAFNNQIASSSPPSYLGSAMGYNPIDLNNNGEIEQIEAELITYLDVSFSNITDLTGIEFFTNLIVLNCNNNQLINLDVTESNSLVYLECNVNQLTSLGITGLSGLKVLYCSVNQLTNLNLTGLNSLEELQCGHNQLSTLNVSEPINLNLLACSNNQLTTLDVTELYNLYVLECTDNPLLNLLIKNNNITWNYLNFSGIPNLQYICADDEDVTFVEQLIISNSYNNCHVNSYCSFNPSGDFNTIAGIIKFDYYSDGCEALDLPQPNIRININDGANEGATFTNASGNYKFYTETGNFELTLNVENPTFFNFSPPSATINFADNNNNITTQNFCISPIGTHPDLEVILAPITPARPGFDATYKLVYRNKGNQTLSQSYGVNFFFNQNLMEFVSASTIPTSAGPGGLSWSYTNLLPFESRSIEITLNINAPTETNPVNIDDILQFTTSILPMAGDETTSDNTFLYNQTVVGSFDPNDITCIEGETVDPSEIGKYLHYSVNFENTGTYIAENVVVKDVIDTTKYDINSLQLLSTSHDAYTRITGNVVEFIFENINLEAKTGNPPVGGHGNVLFKIKSKNDLVSGDSVSKSASIFFDYNAPISTNIEQTTFTSLSNSIFEFDNSVSIYPNPTSSKININSNFNIKSIELYDVQGRVLVTQIGSSKSLDISDKTIGIYFVKITTEKGSKVEKIVKK